MTMLPKEIETIQQEINNKQKNLDIIDEFHKQSAMNTYDIITIIIGIVLFVFIHMAFLLKAILEKDNAFVKDITVIAMLGGFIYVLIYICVQITLWQTAFSPERMRKAIRNINKKMNYDNKDNIQQFFENKSVDYFVLKQLKNMMNDDKIITYGLIYGLKIDLENDLKKLKEKICEIQKTQAEQQDLAKKSILDKQKQEFKNINQ